jgi:phage terminase small subunit
MTRRQQRFVAEYLVDLNAAQAAIRAGYSPRTARAVGCENLTKPHIAAAVDAEQRAVLDRTGITTARALGELELLAFSDIGHYRVDEASGQVQLAPGAPPGAMRAVRTLRRRSRTRRRGREITEIVETEIRLWDKVASLKLAGQHVGLFPDRREHTGKNGKPIAVATRVVYGGRVRAAQGASMPPAAPPSPRTDFARRSAAPR